MEPNDVYAELRPLMFSIAYRMVGGVSDAEDIVQEAFLRYHAAADEGEIESPKAYLAAVTTRLGIDHLRSARVRREHYVGPWLPEPLLTDAAPDAAQHAEAADTLSLAFLVLLESLSPPERAVFLLREVFGYPYDEIARFVGKSEDNCRQLAARARRHVDEGRPRFDTSREEREALSRRFFEAAGEGDTEGLLDLLAADVVLYGDGGGKVPAVPYPLYGRDRVGRALLGFGKQFRQFELGMRVVEVNGQPGALVLDPEGRVAYVVTLDIADGLVQTVRSIGNPDKLRHLGPLADVPRLKRPQ
jgi:RNA polymerase sigma-70 factor (ECF subfamily)